MCGPGWKRLVGHWRTRSCVVSPADLMVEATSGLLDALAPIERYWAFPGPEAYRRVRDLFTAARYDRFARLVAGINRALVTEAYRTASGWSAVSGDLEKAELDGVVAEQAVPARPYFEVLVVETLTADQEHVLREEVRSWRQPDDEFVYELVVVGSGEEAVVAVRLNANLQACVIRRRFAHAAAHDLSGMTYFVGSHIADDLAGSTPEGDARRAFFLSYDDTRCEYLLPDEVEQRIVAGQHVVSATFVTPYPPGCPVLVPGQVFSREILSFMRSLDTPEIHGYDPQAGYRVYTAKAVEIASTGSPQAGVGLD